MHQAVHTAAFRRVGLLSFLEVHSRLESLWTAVYGTVRTVVWEACPTAWGESLLPYWMEVKG